MDKTLVLVYTSYWK